jgi:tetratricopeptide (TPR) repeat protein
VARFGPVELLFLKQFAGSHHVHSESWDDMHRVRTLKLLISTLALIIIACQSSIDKANLCVQLGDYFTAIELFQKELRANPGLSEAHRGLGKALLQRAVDNADDTLSWKEAIVHLTAAQTLQPDVSTARLVSRAWSDLSRKRLALADTLAALDALVSALRYAPDDIDCINRAGIIYFRLGHTLKAETLFKKALALDSTSGYSRFNLGMVYWSQNKIPDAHACWLAALKQDPGDEDLIYWFASAEKKLREKP